MASAYELGLPQADVDALRAVLSDCAAGGDGAPSALERVTGTAYSTAEALHGNPVYRLVALVGLALIGSGLAARGRRALSAGHRAGRSGMSRRR